jgi:hypothetical protein
MKKLLVLCMSLVSPFVFASPSTPSPSLAPSTITSVMNGTISVGTMVSAAPAQTISQTSIGTLTGASTVASLSSTPVVSASIIGTASSTSTGTGYVSPSWNVVDYSGTAHNVSAMSSGSVVTTLTNVIVPVTVVSSHH